MAIGAVQPYTPRGSRFANGDGGGGGVVRCNCNLQWKFASTSSCPMISACRTLSQQKETTNTGSLAPAPVPAVAAAAHTNKTQITAKITAHSLLQNDYVLCEQSVHAVHTRSLAGVRAVNTYFKADQNHVPELSFPSLV